MTEWLISQLRNKYQVAVLSRGYKRRTRGFAIANENTTAIEIGDEPMQFHLKFPSITVAVGEERLLAIPQILHQRPQTEVIILDDAFQHRAVRAGLNLLLTEYSNLYTRDILLPAGDLRDLRSSSKRADIVIVTKCPKDLRTNQRDMIEKELRLSSSQQCLFTSIHYGIPYHLFTRQTLPIDQDSEVLLICGIANPFHLKQYITSQTRSYDMIRYSDHHIFTISDLKDIKHRFAKLTGSKKIIITTEKDAVRLYKFKTELDQFPVYVLPIQHTFLYDGEEKIMGATEKFIQSYGTKTNN